MINLQWGGLTNGYIPSSLLVDVSGRGDYLEPTAAYWWLRMRQDCFNATGRWINPAPGSSAYRPYYLQQEFYNDYINGHGNVAAYPGTSNHGWGRAIDLTGYESSSAVWNWLQAYAPNYGYNWATGQASGERWHWESLSTPGTHPAPIPPKPKEDKVVQSYHREDRVPKSIAPGTKTFLKSADQKSDQNIVGAVGPAYTITPHVYVENLAPGDSIQIALIWENTKYPEPWNNASQHYLETVVANEDGVVNHTVSFFRGVASGDMVFVRVSAPKSNKNTGRITLIDCDSWSFQLA
jgi:hypothetical protein